MSICIPEQATIYGIKLGDLLSLAYEVRLGYCGLEYKFVVKRMFTVYEVLGRYNMIIYLYKDQSLNCSSTFVCKLCWKLLCELWFSFNSILRLLCCLPGTE